MTTPTPHGQVPAIQRYKIGYHADEWGQRSSTPSGIPDASGSWVRYADHVTALAAGQPVVTPQPGAAYAALTYKQVLGSRNCMQCCVSYMLGLPLGSVPDFATDGGWELFSDFAESQGYAAVMLPGNREFEADYLASGTTARGTSHMVVMNDGKLVHDPHPSNAGLVDVQCVWLLAKRATPRTVQADEHAEFETAAKAYTSNVNFERDGTGYADMTAELLWHGWKLRASHGQAPAQAAPAAVAGPSEAAKFTDQSTADPVEKARRYLTAMGDQRTNSAYFYDDGYPRRESAQDALATLAVLEQLAAAPTTQPAPRHQARINGDSAAPKLRAMATNYTAGHQWDKLDAQACILGALEIEALRSQAPQPSPAAQGDARSMLRIVADYSDWLDSKGRLTSFSTFVNEFGYEERDCKSVYEIVVVPCLAARAAQEGKDHG